MKLLNCIYEFLLGDDTDVPFEDPYASVDLPDPEPITVKLVPAPDAA